jgi:hypothetical protein
MLFCYPAGLPVGISLSHVVCAWQARWLQDVANMRKNLNGVSFRRGLAATSSFGVMFFCCPAGTCGFGSNMAGSLAARSGKHAKKTVKS